MLADMFEKRRRLSRDLRNIDYDIAACSFFNPKYWVLRRHRKEMKKEVDVLNHILR